MTFFFSASAAPNPPTSTQKARIAASMGPADDQPELPSPPEPIPPLQEPPAKTEPGGWTWLTGRRQAGESFLLPVLNADRGSLQPSYDPFAAPLPLFGDLQYQSGGDTFVVCDLTGHGNVLFICKRRRGHAEADLLITDGRRLSVVSSRRPDLVNADPTQVQGTPSRPVIVGEVVGDINVRVRTS